ncbi:hypothetical protein ElyMa_003676600 [Elysia marginata]|uniref:Uncharacterized protein n=1 Tax=Elysia marginata TaxID=1093978 RepID=A0AAV4EYJ3_9GAST|nr:hypothetical protein ElyMa_003676600 [Elysia marginata]
MAWMTRGLRADVKQKSVNGLSRDIAWTSPGRLQSVYGVRWSRQARCTRTVSRLLSTGETDDTAPSVLTQAWGRGLFSRRQFPRDQRTSSDWLNQRAVTEGRKGVVCSPSSPLSRRAARD